MPRFLPSPERGILLQCKVRPIAYLKTSCVTEHSELMIWELGFVSFVPVLQNHLATLLRDDSPHTAPVWIGREGDRVLIATDDNSVKGRNTQRDTRAGVSSTAAATLISNTSRAVSKKYVGKPWPYREDVPVALIIGADLSHFPVAHHLRKRPADRCRSLPQRSPPLCFRTINCMNPKSCGIDSCGNPLCEALAPPPVFRSRAQAFPSEFPLLPFQVFANPMCNVVQKFPSSRRKGPSQASGLDVLIVNLDRSDKCAPDRYRRAEPMRSVDEIRSSVSAPEVLNASRGIFRILPSRCDGIQNPLKYYLWWFLSTRER
jgi:hypothetical protein